MFHRFTDKAKMSMNHARMAAQQFGSEEIAPEHVLHGLLNVGDCSAVRILAGLDVDSASLLEELRKLMKRAEFRAETQLPFTTGTKQVLEKALEAAQGAAHDYIGTEHLLLGLGLANPEIVGDLFRAHALTRDVLARSLQNSKLTPEDSAQRAQHRKWVLQGAAHAARELGDEETARRIEALLQRLPA